MVSGTATGDLSAASSHGFAPHLVQGLHYRDMMSTAALQAADPFLKDERRHLEALIERNPYLASQECLVVGGAPAPPRCGARPDARLCRGGSPAEDHRRVAGGTADPRSPPSVRGIAPRVTPRRPAPLTLPFQRLPLPGPTLGDAPTTEPTRRPDSRFLLGGDTARFSGTPQGVRAATAQDRALRTRPLRQMSGVAGSLTGVARSDKPSLRRRRVRTLGVFAPRGTTTSVC